MPFLKNKSSSFPKFTIHFQPIKAQIADNNQRRCLPRRQKRAPQIRPDLIRQPISKSLPERHHLARLDHQRQHPDQLHLVRHVPRLQPAQKSQPPLGQLARHHIRRQSPLVDQIRAPTPLAHPVHQVHSHHLLGRHGSAQLAREPSFVSQILHQLFGLLRLAQKAARILQALRLRPSRLGQCVEQIERSLDQVISQKCELFERFLDLCSRDYSSE